MRTIVLSLAMMICLSGQGYAYTKRDPVMTVFTLQHYCTELLKSSYSVDYNQQYVENVTGYLIGFFDTSNFFLPPKSPDFCVPTDISIKDTCVVFNAWLVRHINDEDVMFASPALVSALKEAYPCKD